MISSLTNRIALATTTASSPPTKRSASPARNTIAVIPVNAVAYCLAAAGTQLAHIDYVAFYDKLLLNFAHLLETHLTFSPRGFGSFRVEMPIWLKNKLV